MRVGGGKGREIGCKQGKAGGSRVSVYVCRYGEKKEGRSEGMYVLRVYVNDNLVQYRKEKDRMCGYESVWLVVAKQQK